jgi:CRP-like cAMP-binding protein
VSARNYEAGATVCARLTTSSQWLGVVDGMVKVEAERTDGKTATFTCVPSGAWFGEGAVIKGEPRPYGVVALRDCTIAFMPRSTFLWLLQESHGFAMFVINQLNARLAYYIGLTQGFRLSNTTAQIAFCLAELFSEDLYPGARKTLPISQEEIGRLSGVSRTVANKVLGELHDRGVIRMGYASIELLDLAELSKLAQSP